MGRVTLPTVELTDTSMSACATSSPDGIGWQGAGAIGSLGTLSMESSACCVSNACPQLHRRVPCGEASRRAGRRKSAYPVRRAGMGNGALAIVPKATAPILDSTDPEAPLLGQGVR
jgi:hypothetical protein